MILAMEWFSIVSLVVSAAALVLSYAAARLAGRSAPELLTKGFQSLAERVTAAEQTVEAQRAQLLAARQEIDGVLEAIEDTLERVERKRRSAAASASRANGVAEPEDPREALRQQVRAAGFEVL